MYGVFKILKYSWLIFMIIFMGKYAMHDPYMDLMGMSHPCNFKAHSSTIKYNQNISERQYWGAEKTVRHFLLCIHSKPSSSRGTGPNSKERSMECNVTGSIPTSNQLGVHKHNEKENQCINEW